MRKVICALALAGASQFAAAYGQCAGDQLSLRFDDLELQSAFAILADFSKMKLVFDESVRWSGPINFDCTSWKVIAQSLADRHHLILKIENGTMHVHR